LHFWIKLLVVAATFKRLAESASAAAEAAVAAAEAAAAAFLAALPTRSLFLALSFAFSLSLAFLWPLPLLWLLHQHGRPGSRMANWEATEALALVWQCRWFC
jgi:hypothetical protein